MSCNPQPAGGGPPGSAADAVADVGGLRRVDHPGDLQLDVRRQGVEQPEPLTEQHRELVNLQLVQHSGLQRPLRRVRACTITSRSPAAVFACVIALSIPSVTYVTDG